MPYTRGDEVSRPLEDVLAEVAGLAAQGVKEVTLLGQNVNAWRGELVRAAGMSAPLPRKRLPITTSAFPSRKSA